MKYFQIQITKFIEFELFHDLQQKSCYKTWRRWRGIDASREALMELAIN
jgi:hypothetical protein